MVNCRHETESSHWQYSVKNDALKNFTNFSGKHLCWIVFLIKFQTFCPYNICGEAILYGRGAELLKAV